MVRTFLRIGAAFSFVSVAFGAFGAHLLKDRLDAHAHTVWETAAQYQMAHALALLLVALLLGRSANKKLELAGWLFTGGIVLFSGSLYLLALTGVKALGAITPLGGLCFLSGWVCVFVGAEKETGSRK